MADTTAAATADTSPQVEPRPARFLRTVAWLLVFLTIAFLVNNFLIFWGGFPEVISLIYGDEVDALVAAPVAVYAAAIVGAFVIVARAPDVTLRQDADRISGYNAFFIRAAFWIVLIVGLGDTVISFLRVEDLLPVLFGDDIASNLGRSAYRGAYVHVPLMALSVLIAARTRTLGFTWLALLVVIAELLIVVGRFIFSYEQAFMADLVRFWYAALFLFASAYTLIEDGHVRVDVLYSGFSDRGKGRVNAWGSVLLGISLCWVILAVGMWGKASIINSPLLSFEVTQAGFGLYVKYMMAGFLGVFAVSMMLQFTSYLLESVADMRGEPGKRQVAAPAAH